ncbi:hypothetical protein [Larsenimonas suaedae]|uniref:Uncharacterized protein n=1 Tax=Larsenimonas suaedae TaxID=1851019 RepID=A0ABU1GZA4_9GAMM|nr:hypothetical protein [Larsenimonas suaedae]MCM2973785.1 hypothetical protein [Larsenimonas suaedae]MDR5897309.1 hypothetical protein [Larsenimonas suaedae]
MKNKPRFEFEEKDVNAWRGEDPEAEKAKKVEASTYDAKDTRITKTVRMRMRYGEFLRDQAHARTVEKGSKVSEADVLDEIMQEYIVNHKLHA